MKVQSSVSGHTRREFTRRAAGFSSVALFGGLLGACGDSDDAPTKSAAKPGGGPLGPATLTFVGWEGYDAQAKTFRKTMAWMKQEQLELESTYVTGNDEMLVKVQSASPGTYDLTCPAHLNVEGFIAAGVLEPIDTSRMKNWESILPTMRDVEVLRGPDGKIFGVPFTFSFQTPLYNADRVKPLDSFGQLVDDPAVRKRYTISDAPGNFTWIAQVLGLGNPDPNHLSEAELEQCKKYARDVVRNARSVAGTNGDIYQLLVTGEVDYSTNGTYDQVADAQKEGVNLDSFFPQEGAQSFVDLYCIPKGSENYDVALAWIDHMLTPEPQAEIAEVYGGAVVNLEAVSLMPKDRQKRYDYTNLEGVLERAPVLPAVPAESDEFTTFAEWTKAWNEVK